MDIHKFCKMHIEKLDIPKNEKIDFLKYYDLFLDGDNSPCFTVMDNDIVKGCAGIRGISKGVGEAWVVFNHDFLDKHKKVLCVKIKNYIDFISVTYDLHRIQALVECDNDIHRKFIEVMGFQFEGTLRAYDEYKNDWLMFSIVKGV